MANITTRTEPFRELANFDPLRDFEALPSFGRLRRLLQEMPTEPAIKLEVAEDDKAYTVKAELPGVNKEDIAVDVDGNQVCISAEVKRDKVEAEYLDGILEITLPKNGKAQATKIAVQ